MLELARADFAIIRWTSVNPGGPDDHFAVIRYGLRPDALSRTAVSPIRLNRRHRSTTYRVLVTGLESRTTYYYRIASTDGAGMSDGMESGVGLFTTPAARRRVDAIARTIAKCPVLVRTRPDSRPPSSGTPPFRRSGT